MREVRILTRVAAESDPQSACEGVLGDWLPLQIELVEAAAGRKLIEQYVHRYHYLGYPRPLCRTVALPGAKGGKAPHPVLEAVCYSHTSAARRMAPRDRWIGWNDEIRRHGLPRVVNNSRFLILPWVKIPHLASHIAVQSCRMILASWLGPRYAVGLRFYWKRWSMPVVIAGPATGLPTGPAWARHKDADTRALDRSGQAHASSERDLRVSVTAGLERPVVWRRNRRAFP